MRPGRSPNSFGSGTSVESWFAISSTWNPRRTGTGSCTSSREPSGPGPGQNQSFRGVGSGPGRDDPPTGASLPVPGSDRDLHPLWRGLDGCTRRRRWFAGWRGVWIGWRRKEKRSGSSSDASGGGAPDPGTGAGFLRRHPEAHEDEGESPGRSPHATGRIPDAVGSGGDGCHRSLRHRVALMTGFGALHGVDQRLRFHTF